MFQRSELSWWTKQSDKNVFRHRLKIPTIGKYSKTELFREIQTFYTTNNDIRMNPNSTNPFINQLDQINDTFLLNLPPLSQSTPAPQALSQQQMVPNTTILVQPPIVSDKTIKHFGGFMHEDGAKFLAEFVSYLTLSAIEPESPRAVAAFHLHLTGPALIWFNTLTIKDSWTTVKACFLAEYANSLNNPSLIAESLAFDNIKLGQTQAIEDFHSTVLDKGRRLHKSDTDMTNKFIARLPPQLAFFVRAARVSSFRDALQSAKIGEAHGYRQSQGPPAVVPPVSTTTNTVNAASDSVQMQLDNITQTLNTILIKPSTAFRTDTQPSKYNQQPGPSHRTCFRCKGPYHVKSRCNWDGQGEASPNIQCQLCSQWGHDAPRCVRLSGQLAGTVSPDKCQLCQQPEHTAAQCPQLNKSGLGTVRTSQA